MERVKFYSAADLSCGYNLKITQQRVDREANNAPSNINDFIEVYNVKKFLIIKFT